MPTHFQPPPSWSNQPPPQPRRMDYRTKRALWVVAGFLGVAAIGGVIISPDDPAPKPAAAVQAGDAQRFVLPSATSAPAQAPVATTEATTQPAATLTTTPAPATTRAKPKPTTVRPTTAKPRTTAPKPRPTTRKPKPKPTTESTRSGVHPGAFCSPEGAMGTTVKGTLMRCTLKSGEDRARWRAA
jgi:hypothetical protein